jgi:drug/metabolite transporter (DMT)-like permease
LTNGFAIAFFVLALGCGLLLVREVRQVGGDPLTRQERLNRNLQIIAGLLGFVLALTIDLIGGSAEDGALSSDPLPPTAAILLILVLGVLVPAISIYWHRIIDEQEADASKTGALFAFYFFGIGAPLWWLAWRGGFAPPPNGFTIYFATMTVMGVVWLWKKYR